jgi:glutathione S-transferase
MTTTDASLPRLTYFVFRGLGELIRLLFEDLGQPYEDVRVEFGPEWNALKPQMRFGQLPRLEIGGLTLFQSQAILRHLGRINHLCGETEADRIRCDTSFEAARDAQQRLWDHFWSPGSNTAEAAQAFAAGQLAEVLATLGGWLGDAPYFGGDQLLVADYYALTVVDEAAAFFPAAVEAAPSIAAYRRRMHARSGIAAYIASGRQSPWFGFDTLRGIRGPGGSRGA